MLRSADAKSIVPTIAQSGKAHFPYEDETWSIEPEVSELDRV